MKSISQSTLLISFASIMCVFSLYLMFTSELDLNQSPHDFDCVATGAGTYRCENTEVVCYKSSSLFGIGESMSCTNKESK